MDKLKKVLSGDDEDEERGIVAEVKLYLESTLSSDTSGEKWGREMSRLLKSHVHVCHHHA